MNTTPYDMEIAPAAARQLRALPAKDRKTVISFIEALAINPRPPGSKKIEGMIGLYEEHISHLRLIYKIDEQKVLLLLVK